MTIFYGDDSTRIFAGEHERRMEAMYEEEDFDREEVAYEVSTNSTTKHDLGRYYITIGC
jgi:hypothetical protein